MIPPSSYNYPIPDELQRALTMDAPTLEDAEYVVDQLGIPRYALTFFINDKNPTPKYIEDNRRLIKNIQKISKVMIQKQVVFKDVQHVKIRSLLYNEFIPNATLLLPLSFLYKEPNPIPAF